MMLLSYADVSHMHNAHIPYTKLSHAHWLSFIHMGLLVHFSWYCVQVTVLFLLLTLNYLI